VIAIALIYLVFGVGFVVRPIGGIIFGWVADRRGRKLTFVLTLIVMGVGTVLMGVLPTYQTFGVMAAALLMILRIVQGLSLGGESATAVTYVWEHSPPEKRGFLTSIINWTGAAASYVGLFVVAGLSLGLGSVAFAAYGWRIAFLVSGILLAIGLFMRVRLTETPVFEEMKKAKAITKSPLLESLRTQWKNMVKVGLGIQAGTNVIYYAATVTPLIIMTTFMQPKVALGLATLLIGVVSGLGSLLIPIFGFLGDKYGRKIIVYPPMVAGGVAIIPSYYLLGYAGAIGNIYLMGVAIFIPIACVMMIYGGTYAMYSEAFPAALRVTSFAIAYGVAVGFVGGFTPYIQTAILGFTPGVIWITGLWPAAVALLSAIVGILFVKETAPAVLAKKAKVPSA
jgi:MFS family permease